MEIKAIIEGIIKAEGGYVNNSKDSGGPTKYGITIATLGSWLGRRASIDEVKKITKVMAYNIYYNKYYIDTHVSKLAEVLQPVMLDITVNSWIKVATVILQTAINRLNNDSAVEVDGKLGQRTIQESDKLCISKSRELINTIVSIRKDFYLSIVENTPSQKIFLTGWLNRANSFSV